MLIANPPLFSPAQKAKIFEWIRAQGTASAYEASHSDYMELGT